MTSGAPCTAPWTPSLIVRGRCAKLVAAVANNQKQYGDRDNSFLHINLRLPLRTAVRFPTIFSPDKSQVQAEAVNAHYFKSEGMSSGSKGLLNDVDKIAKGVK